MDTIYVTSMQDFAGKTSVAIGLAKHLRRDGLAVGYMKPLATRVQQAWTRGAEQPIAPDLLQRGFGEALRSFADPRTGRADLPILLGKTLHAVTFNRLTPSPR